MSGGDRHATDRSEIERTLYSYCDLVDRALVDEVAELFTSDAVIDYGYDRLIVGRENIRALFRDRLSRYQATSHHASNVTIDLVGDERAVASSAVYAWHRLPDGGTAEVWGRYHDDLVRDGDRWRLASRRIRAAGWTGFDIPEGLPGPFEPIDRKRDT
jgi:ketosteroid isomerase-like protein